MGRFMIEQFQINQSAIRQDKIDGEITLVNLKTARYFTLNDSGSTFWEALSKLHDLPSIQAWAEHKFLYKNCDMPAEVESFINQLFEYQLISKVDFDHRNDSGHVLPTITPLESEGQIPFVTPQLQLGPNLSDLDFSS